MISREGSTAGHLVAPLVDLGGFPPYPDTAAFVEDVYRRPWVKTMR